MKKTKNSQFLWDLWCSLSIIGIWPRFIEPQWLRTTHLTLHIEKLSPALEGLKIVQFSDLHLSSHTSQNFLNRLTAKIKRLQPDLLAFTGDFLCYSTLFEPARLTTFLNQFKAPLGCYAVLGNHDYQENVFVNDQGDYAIASEKSSIMGESFRRLLALPKLSKQIAEKVYQIPPHQDLVKILENSPFELLDNRTKQISQNGAHLNVTGVGEHMLGRCKPEIAFKNYLPEFPGLVLAHNPDCVPQLLSYPGDIILAGHTHGAQLNIPFLWKRFTLLENPLFKRGLFSLKKKWLYVNRGIGSTLPFRWLSPPEILSLTLKSL